MEITVEISYYPLMVDYLELVEQFLQKLAENKRVKLEIGTMSSLIIGTHDEVMELLKVQLKPFLEKLAGRRPRRTLHPLKCLRRPFS